MSANLNVVSSQTKCILMVVANPGTSTTVGGAVGFWASELIHAWYEFTEVGYAVTMAMWVRHSQINCNKLGIQSPFQYAIRNRHRCSKH
jgi:putative intracellular protease/amidase